MTGIFLRATVVTRGWNGYRNKSQHRKSTLEKKILPPFQQGFEPATFQSRVRCSNHWAIPAPPILKMSTREIYLYPPTLLAAQILKMCAREIYLYPPTLLAAQILKMCTREIYLYPPTLLAAQILRACTREIYPYSPTLLSFFVTYVDQCIWCLHLHSCWNVFTLASAYLQVETRGC